MTERKGVIQGRCVNEVVAGRERDEDAVDHETETDEGTETEEADHGKELVAQKIIEEKEADLEKEKGSS